MSDLSAIRAQLVAGDLARAEAALRAHLAARPDDAEALGLLGVIAGQAGRVADAVELLRHAAAGMPGSPEAQYNLGRALHQAERRAEAAEAYGAAVRLAPGFALAHNNLGNVLFELGRADEAVACYRRALAADPRLFEAHRNLGLSLMRAEDRGGAEPHLAAAADAARDLAREGARIGQAGQGGEALAALTRATELAPGDATIWNDLGNALTECGRNAEAVGAYDRALKLSPGYAVAWRNLGFALYHLRRVGDSEAACREAIRLDPGLAAAWLGLGTARDALGDPQGAIAAWTEAVRLDPTLCGADQNSLFSLNYRDDLTPAAVAEGHRAWAARWVDGVAPLVARHANDRDPDRPLRVGLVSADFRYHSVSMFLLPWMAVRPRDGFALHCYANVAKPDEMTGILRGHADAWVDIAGVSDEAAARRIVDDRIDVLIDAAGHTRGNRLELFARRPAPVQATWLGYPNTTGMRAIDWRLTDPIADPPGAADALHAERLLRMADGFLCWAPPARSPDVAPPPALAEGCVTFGCFNNTAKISPAAAAAWARILDAVPGARLILKSWIATDPAVHRTLLERFTRHGIAAERIGFMAGQDVHDQHLGQYARIDVALDPFPYNGTTTTFEALWMGVPVVALAGDRHAARMGASILTRVGHAALVAGSIDDYVALAASLGRDPARIAALRARLRGDLTGSPLCDQPGFARAMAGAIRTMWRVWATAPR